MVNRQRIIIDTDPGIDDAIALMLAATAPEIDLLAVTTVSGCVGVAQTTQNALAVLSAIGRADVPVYAGAAQALSGAMHSAEVNHGASGLGDVLLPVGAAPQTEPADVFLRRALQQAEPQSISLLCLAPLTNIATALRAEPALAGRIKHIIAMGGAVRVAGNTSPVAEFNFYADALAADIVCQSGAKLTFVTWDCAWQALTSAQRRADIAALATPAAHIVARLLDTYRSFDEQLYGTDGGMMPDPLVIAALLQPDLFYGKDCAVRVETEGRLTRGQMVVDEWGLNTAPTHAHILLGVDGSGFYRWLLPRLAQLPWLAS